MVLGTLIAVLSVFTAVSSYQGSIADSKQNESEIQGMKDLNDGNAVYLEANQFIVYDYSMYDGWYTAEPGSDQEQYYQDSYSPALQESISANPDDPFSEAYYNTMYADANDYWAASDAAFETADIVLMTDDLSHLPWLIRHARRALKIIKQSITFALSIKALFILLTLFGYATLWMAIMADTGASLLVVFNGLRLLKR